MSRRLVFELNIDNDRFWPSKGRDTLDQVRLALEDMLGDPYRMIAEADSTEVDVHPIGRIYLTEGAKDERTGG